MGRMAFVAMLFVMAAACLGLAFTSSSWGWGTGGIIFLSAGIYALRQFKEERVIGHATASNKFIIFAFLALFLGFAIIVFLSEA
jgi:hypothetical protein